MARLGILEIILKSYLLKGKKTFDPRVFQKEVNFFFKKKACKKLGKKTKKKKKEGKGEDEIVSRKGQTMGGV